MEIYFYLFSIAAQLNGCFNSNFIFSSHQGINTSSKQLSSWIMSTAGLWCAIVVSSVLLIFRMCLGNLFELMIMLKHYMLPYELWSIYCQWQCYFFDLIFLIGVSCHSMFILSHCRSYNVTAHNWRGNWCYLLLFRLQRGERSCWITHAVP